MVVDAVEQAREDLGSVVSVSFGGVVSLASRDRDELGAGVEEAASFADGLEVAVECGGAGAVAVAEQPAVVGSEASHVGAFGGDGDGFAGAVAGFDGMVRRSKGWPSLRSTSIPPRVGPRWWR